jgi:class 3 adenylate cyclase
VSPSPTSRAVARLIDPGRARQVRSRVARAWAAARGRLAHHVVHVRADGARSWRIDASHDGDDGPAAATDHDSFACWCAAHPGVDASLRVSGQLVHSLVVEPSLPLRGVEAVRRYARQQFTHYHGAQAADWPVTVWTDGVHSVACALHGLDLPALREAAGRHDVRLRGMTPVWSAGIVMLARARPAFAGPGRHGLLVVEGAAATWLVAEDGVVTSLRQRYADSAHGQAVAQLLQALVSESLPLAGPPAVLGWGVEAPCDWPEALASPIGDPTGAGVLTELMLTTPGRRP